MKKLLVADMINVVVVEDGTVVIQFKDKNAVAFAQAMMTPDIARTLSRDLAEMAAAAPLVAQTVAGHA